MPSKAAMEIVETQPAPLTVEQVRAELRLVDEKSLTFAKLYGDALRTALALYEKLERRTQALKEIERAADRWAQDWRRLQDHAAKALED